MVVPITSCSILSSLRGVLWLPFADSHNAGNDAIANLQAHIAIGLDMYCLKLKATKDQGKLLVLLYFHLHLLLMSIVGRAWVDDQLGNSALLACAETRW